MSNIRKEDTSPATKADIALVLEKLGALAGDVSSSKRSIETLERKFAEHEKVMHAQFERILKHIDEKVEEVREDFAKEFKTHDDACYNRFVEQGNSLRALDRRVCVLERRDGVPS